MLRGMRVYRYWARHEEPDPDWPVASWGASERSAADARADAARRARELVERLRAGLTAPRGGYAYGNQPMREEVLQEIGDPASPDAIITRNAYGALVLNTARVLFADVDLPPQGLVAWVRSLFGMGDDKAAQAIIERIESVAAADGLGLRLYRTCAGFRCLVTSRPFDPAVAETAELLVRLGSDPLYIRLCNTQECFRARLTPKPWRCGVPAPSVRFPFSSPEAERTFGIWLARYERRAVSRATCALVATMGVPTVHRDAEPIVRIHDEWTIGEGELA